MNVYLHVTYSYVYVYICIVNVFFISYTHIVYVQVDCLEWLLDHGGSVRDKDNLGGTPLHDAAEQGQVFLTSLISLIHSYTNIGFILVH